MSKKKSNKIKLKEKKNYAKKRSRQLKSKITKAEKILYDALIREGIIFQFRKPFYDKKLVYIVDFYFENIFGKKYVIEIDGKSHNEKTRNYDIKRSFYLYHAKGCCVKRFKNEEVFENLDSVLDRIYKLEPRYFDIKTKFDKEMDRKILISN